MSAVMLALTVALAQGPGVEPTSSVDDVSDRGWRFGRRARTFHGFGGSFFVLGLALRLGGVAVIQSSGDKQPGLGLMASGTSFNAAGLVMVGLGGHALGRLHALEDREYSVRRRRVAGWSLFAAGAVLFAASRAVPLACFSTQCAVATSEVGYYAGLTGMAVGLHLAATSLGYAKQRGLTVRPDVRLGGRSSRVGIAVVGRF